MKSDQAVLDLFHHMAERVPAYKDFLKKAGVKPKTVKTIADFKRLPIIDKKNYLRQYPLPDLCWDGDLKHAETVSVSSGSSGEAFFWPQDNSQYKEGILIHRDIYKKIFHISNQKTLIVICFSMGTWIAGPFTMLSTLGAKKFFEGINIITPGIDREDAIQGIKNLAPFYERIVIAGYPPIVKDIVDSISDLGISLKKHKVSLLVAGEPISEQWRDYMFEEIGSKDIYKSIINIYGTADATIVGHETPLSIALRRSYNSQPVLLKRTFGVDITPTLVQYYPSYRYLEEVNGEIVISARLGLPLCRYNIHDFGKIFSKDDLILNTKEQLASYVESDDLKQLNKWQNLPFVSVNGRSNFSISLYGLIIFPENIKTATMHQELRHVLSGKFTMETKYDSKMQQYFELNIELRQGIEPSIDLQKTIKKIVIETLREFNAEYRKLHKSIGKSSEPRIKLYEHGHKSFNTTRSKHQWIRHSNGSSTLN